MSRKTKWTGWLDLRPGEARSVGIALASAFLLLAALTLARSLREAMYLGRFAVETLPYVTAAAVAINLPVVIGFTRLLQRYSPSRVVFVLGLVEAAGLLPIWFLVGTASGRDLGIVLLYLWTSLGMLALISGFWVDLSERFSVRAAKRLFGVISAGGTAGAMTMGALLPLLARNTSPEALIPVLVLLLGGLLVCRTLLPPRTIPASPSAASPTPAGGAMSTAASSTPAEDPALRSTDTSPPTAGLHAIWASKHLRLIALITISATVASGLLDYQFKEYAQRAYAASPDGTVWGVPSLTAFFGAFYGWTGLVAMAVQLLLTGRIVRLLGTGAIAVLPSALLLGTAGFVAFPGLLAITATRGADASFRRAIFRPTMELLYVPLPAELKQRTKTFLDSFADSLAEAGAAGIVFLWVTVFALPSRGLSAIVAFGALALLYASLRMGREYLRSVVDRLRAEDADTAPKPAGGLDGFERFTATLTQIRSMEVLAARAEASAAGPPAKALTDLSTSRSATESTTGSTSPTRRSIAPSPDPSVNDLITMLARDDRVHDVAERLLALGSAAVPPLRAHLLDQDGDFVIRRRIPRVLARSDERTATAVLIEGLEMERFEIRYRCGVALARQRRKSRLLLTSAETEGVWRVIEAEVAKERPVWELQRLLDDNADTEVDELVGVRIEERGALSLEHTFRLLSFVLDPDPVSAAYQALGNPDERVRGLALEYLEHVLPARIRDRLWLFIGDPSARQVEKASRPVEDVVADLASSQATLFVSETDHAALRRLLEGS
ncbi:MAG: hypothetical protein KDA27_16650 [Candidatus Eisenbacteria bacterium]|uniref:ADP,ATP carrier protein n=1 Tax=Eiseniibacteriota bacterium TaxID=2212470 RepID=A0A956NEH5_UNCEI|nr:hypothetical protein [Candidatus Eisenbacteria bacterium]